MTNKIRRICLTIVGGIMLLTSAGIVHAQSTADFSGTWNTVTSRGKKIVLTLQSSSRRTVVSGTYARNGLSASVRRMHETTEAFVTVSFTSGLLPQSASSINGTVKDNVLRFKWAEDGGRGSGKFTMSSDGQSFEGSFSMTDNPDDASGGTWNGTRAPNFAGAWRTAPFPDIVLQQTGSSVSGFLSAANPMFGEIRDGVITGNTLRFTIWRTNLPGRSATQFAGEGQLVMEKGSKAFNGTIMGSSVNGTRLGR